MSRACQRLDCGCPRNSATAICGCLYCGNTRCYEHRNRPHICPECPGCGFRHGYPLHEWDAARRRLITVGVAA